MANIISAVESAKSEFAEICTLAGSNTVIEETAALSIGREFLPDYAIKVLDDQELTSEETLQYYVWLTLGVQTAMDEDARELAAGHEWHD
jgi:radical SAM superfamily enzyme